MDTIESLDRRWSPRVNQEFLIRYRASSLEFRRGRLLNVSRTGARLVVDAREIAAGPYLEFEVVMGGRILRLAAQRRWEKRLGEGYGVIVGVSFVGTRSRREVANWVASELHRSQEALSLAC